MKTALVAAAGLALSLAAPCLAQPVLNGTRSGDEAFYGAPKWIQTVPTSFPDNHPANQAPCSTVGNGVTIALDNSNAAGVTGGSAVGSELVTTGIEIRVPLSQLGNPAGDIRVAGFVNGGGHDFLSNQVVGGLDAGTGNLGEPRNVDFSVLNGNQFLTVANPAMPSTTPAVMDGQLGSDPYGLLLFAQQNPTGFGDSNLGVVDFANGSEIDGMYGYVFEADLDGPGPEPTQRYLQILITGNLESNFNKLDVFFDSVAGGQNQLRGDNPDVDFNGLNRMGNDGSGNGLRFDTGFEADRYLQFTCGNSPLQTFASYAEVLTGGGGSGNFIGSGGAGASPLNGAVVCPPLVPDIAYAFGSEINSVYAHLDAGGNRLYVLVTGNFASNTGDKLNMFFDANGNPAGDEGQNVILPSNVIISVADGGGGSLRRMATDGINAGLTFDAGFHADYYANFHFEATPIRHVMDAAVLRTGGRLVNGIGNSLDYGAFNGVNMPGIIPFDQTNFTDFTGPVGIQFQDGFLPDIYTSYAPREAGRVLAEAIMMGISDIPTWEAFVPTEAVPGLILVSSNNSNTGGVTQSDASGAAGAVTGLEFSIDLDELGWDGSGQIRMAGFISSPNFATVSNQVFGDAVGAPPLGEVRTVNFSLAGGNQFVVLAGGGGGADCNGNGTDDAVEIAGNPALDCYNPAVVMNPHVIGGADGLLDACQCQGNFNRDGAVNSTDISTMLTGWIASLNAANTNGDVDCSGSTNSTDVSVFLTIWINQVNNVVPFDGCP